MYKPLFTYLILIGLTFVIKSASANTINAVTSFGILADVVKNVGGEHVKVTSIVPPNGDPHSYEPSPGDVKLIKSADVIFLSGMGLENWFQRLAKAAGTTTAPIAVSKGIETYSVTAGYGHFRADPHVWNDVDNVQVWVNNIEAALIEVRPDLTNEIQQAAHAYREKLTALDASIHAKLTSLPTDKRDILTNHDAVSYYTKAYGVRFLSPQGVSTETEASAATIAKLIDQIKQLGVTRYFLENSNNTRLIKQIANATGAKPGGRLYPESLSEENGPAPTYIKLMQYNTQQIVTALYE